MKYLVAVALAFGALTLAAIDVQAKVVCGPNGCHHVYPYRSQWPVSQSGKYYNTAPWGCAMVGGQRVCHHRQDGGNQNPNWAPAPLRQRPGFLFDCTSAWRAADSDV